MTQPLLIASTAEDRFDKRVKDAEAAIKAWKQIDPDVVELAGISEGELARFRDPAPFTPPASPVPQPPIDPDQPRMRGYPDKLYARMVATPDEVMAEAMRQSEPPVPPKED